jgi:hypothetical protein
MPDGAGFSELRFFEFCLPTRRNESLVDPLAKMIGLFVGALDFGVDWMIFKSLSAVDDPESVSFILHVTQREIGDMSPRRHGVESGVAVGDCVILD